MRPPDFYEDFSRGLDDAVWSSWGMPAPYVMAGLLYIPFDPRVTKKTVGVSLRKGQTYGKFSLRMQATAGNFKTCPLLWPVGGAWTTEYDIAEGADRNKPTQTLHYGDGVHSLQGEHHMIHRSLKLTPPGLTSWTTVTTEWSKGKLRTTTSRSKGLESVIEDPHVPDTPMSLHIQVGQPGMGSDAGVMIVDWVKTWEERA